MEHQQRSPHSGAVQPRRHGGRNFWERRVRYERHRQQEQWLGRGTLPQIVVVGNSYNGAKWNFLVARYLPSEPEIGSFTASAYTVAAGSSVTLTASNITGGNPGATITQVAFYYVDGSGNQQLLGYGTQTSPGVWTFSFTVSLAPGSYTLYAQATDSFGAVGDPVALTLTVQ